MLPKYAELYKNWVPTPEPEKTTVYSVRPQNQAWRLTSKEKAILAAATMHPNTKDLTLSET